MKKENSIEELTLRELKEKIENESGEFDYLVEFDDLREVEDGTDNEQTGTSKN